VNFLADEDIDRQVVDSLRLDGHHVRYIAEMEPGITDESVLELATQGRLLLLTADKDFGELIFRHHRQGSGIVLLRLAKLSPVRKAEIVTSVVSRHESEPLESFAVITPGRIRIRRWSRLDPEL